jgi:hypothetical protein
VKRGDASGRLGATTLVHRTQGTAASRWLLVGCGKHAEFNTRRLASALGSGRLRLPMPFLGT